MESPFVEFQETIDSQRTILAEHKAYIKHLEGAVASMRNCSNCAFVPEYDYSTCQCPGGVDACGNNGNWEPARWVKL